jgi:transcriptional regulator
MYVPAHFAETDSAALHNFIERHSFGLLVSQVDGVPFATHLPLLLDRDSGPHGTLIGHVARANPQWQELAGRAALAVFGGPHAYVSPTWYESAPGAAVKPGSAGDRPRGATAVPTWNYVAVHATGRAELVEAPDALLEIVQRSVTVYEASMPNPWVLDASGPFVERLLAQIVGFRIRIDALEGKWKLSQNHPAERREKVIRALEAQGGENATGVAALMRERLPK